MLLPRFVLPGLLCFVSVGSMACGGAATDGDSSGEGEGEGPADSCDVITEEQAASVLGQPIVRLDTTSDVNECRYMGDADINLPAVHVRLDTSSSFCVAAPERADVEALDLGDACWVGDDGAQLCQGNFVVTLNVIHAIGAPSFKAGLRSVLETVSAELP
jgi:hypothetical protein